MLNNFDIIIPLYNKKENIIILIDFLLENDFYYNKIIVLDDCSTDGSYEEIKNKYLNNNKLIIKQMTVNSGPQNVRIRASEISKSEWLFFIDADDSININNTKKIINLLKSNSLESYDLIYGNTIKIINGNQKFNNYNKKASIINNDLDFFYFPKPTMTGLLLKKDCIHFMNVGNLNWGEDLIFFHRIITSKRVYYIPVDIGIYNIVSTSRGAGSLVLKDRFIFLKFFINDLLSRKIFFTKLTGILYWIYFTFRTLIAFIYKKIKYAK